MATRKNTQSAEDSLQGGQPEQAEAQIAAGETDQQPTGGGIDDAGLSPAPAAGQNTQSAEDSLKGAQPEQAEAEQQAAAQETGQQQTGGSDEGDTGSAAGQEYDAARATLMTAISSIGGDQSLILPSGMEIRLLRRLATAASTVLHDLMLYTSGDQIAVTEVDFTALSKVGAVVETDWAELALENA